MKLNGNLVLNTDASGEIQNLYVERLSADPASQTSANKGRIYFNTTTAEFKFYDGAGWVPFATGGDAAGIQVELDALEAALGASINTDGTFNAAAFSAFANVHTPTSVTNALAQLDSAISGKDTLDEILPGTNGQVIYNNAGTWTAAATGATSGVQANDPALDSIASLTTAANQMLYTTAGDTYATASLTAYARTLLDDADSATARTTLGVVIGTDVQAFDPDLSAIAALTPAAGNFIVGTASGYESQTPSQVQTTLSLVPGTNVQAYDVDLAQLAAFTPASGDFIVGNGGAEGARYSLLNGSAARTALGLGTAATHAAGDFIAVDGSSVVSADIGFNGNKVTGIAPAEGGTDAVNKNQLDAAVAGLSWKTAARAASTANVDLASAPAALDGVTLAANDRVLIKDQTAPAENGIYVFTAAAAALTRSTDMDDAVEFEGSAIFVGEGTLNAGSGWTQVNAVTTVGTDPVSFTQFTGAGTYSAGTGLSLAGNTFNVNLGAGIAQLPTDEVGIDLFNPTTGALILTSSGTDRTTDTAAQLQLLTNTAQLDQGVGGLFIVASGVTATELAASVAGSGLTGGAGSALAVNVDDSTIEVATNVVQVKDAGITNTKLSTGGVITLQSNSAAQVEPMELGQDLNFEVTSGTGLAVAVSDGNVVTFSGIDATDSVKGVASFDSGDFTVTAGVVTANDLALDDLSDVTITSATGGDAVIFNGSEFVNQQIYFLYQAVSASTSHSVGHNLGQKYCNVTVVDDTDEVVIPQSITYVDANTLTVTFNSPLQATVVVMGVNAGGV
jgi:hypothetical protein